MEEQVRIRLSNLISLGTDTTGTIWQRLLMQVGEYFGERVWIRKRGGNA